eukprot:UN30904
MREHVPSEFLPHFRKLLSSLDSTNATQVAKLSQNLLVASNALNDVSHFGRKYATNENELNEMVLLDDRITDLAESCKQGHRKGLVIFAQSRTFTKTATRRLDLIVTLARDQKLKSADKILTRMIETLQDIITEHEDLDTIMGSLDIKANDLLRVTTGVVQENLDLASEHAEGWSLSKKMLVYSLASLGGYPVVAAASVLHWFDNDRNDRKSREYYRMSRDFDSIWQVLSHARTWIQVGIEQLKVLVQDLDEARKIYVL